MNDSKKTAKVERVKKASVTKSKKSSNALSLQLRSLKLHFDGNNLHVTSNSSNSRYKNNYIRNEELKRLSFKIKTECKKLVFPNNKSDLSEDIQNFFNFFAVTDLSLSPSSSYKKDVANELSGQAIACPAASELVTIDDALASSSPMQSVAFTFNFTQDILTKIERNGLAFVSAKLMQRQLRRYLGRTVDIAFAFEYVERKRKELHQFRGMNPHIHGVVLLRHEEVRLFKSAMISFNTGDKTVGFNRHEFSTKREKKSREDGIQQIGLILNDLKYSSYTTKKYNLLKAIYRQPEGVGIGRILASKYLKIDNTIHGSLFYCSKDVSIRATEIYNEFIKIHNETLTDAEIKKQRQERDIDMEGFEDISTETIPLTEKELLEKEIKEIEESITSMEFFKSDAWKAKLKRRQLVKAFGISKYDYNAQSHYGMNYY